MLPKRFLRACDAMRSGWQLSGHWLADNYEPLLIYAQYLQSKIYSDDRLYIELYSVDRVIIREFSEDDLG